MSAQAPTVLEDKFYSFVDQCFPLVYQAPTRYKEEGSWLYRKAVWLYNLEQNTGLVRQTVNVVANVIITADRLFEKFPKLVGKWAVFGLSAFGYMSITYITNDIFKTAIDFGTSLLHKNFGYAAYKLLKIVIQVTDLALLVGVCTVSTLNLFRSDIYDRFYKLITPYGIASFTAGLGVTVFDLYLDTKLYRDLSVYKLSTDLDDLSTRQGIFLKKFYTSVVKEDYVLDDYTKKMIDELKSHLKGTQVEDLKKFIATDLKDWQPGTDFTLDQEIIALGFYNITFQNEIVFQIMSGNQDIQDDLRNYLKSMTLYNDFLNDSFSQIIEPRKHVVNPLAERFIRDLELTDPENNAVIKEKMGEWKPYTDWTFDQQKQAREIYQTLRSRLHTIDEKNKQSFDKLTHFFCTQVMRPIQEVKDEPEFKLADRIIMQLNTYDFTSVRQTIHSDNVLKDWKPGSTFSPEQLNAAKNIFKFNVIGGIEQHMWHKSSSFMMTIFNYAALALCKLFPNTPKESFVRAVTSCMMWSNCYNFYVQSEKRKAV